jgi:ClpA/ClpB-like protein
MTGLDLAEADFDTDSLALIDLARQTARSLDHGYVGTEHLLLASAQLLPEVRAALSDDGLAGTDRLATELQRMVDAHPEWSPYIDDDDALAAIGVDGPVVRELARADNRLVRRSTSRSAYSPTAMVSPISWSRGWATTRRHY